MCDEKYGEFYNKFGLKKMGIIWLLYSKIIKIEIIIGKKV